MLMTEVRTIAKAQGLKTARMSKAEIIKLIQGSEGNFECFATPVDGFCDQMNCLWREDCLPAAAKAMS